jgi:hypothetical protein
MWTDEYFGFARGTSSTATSAFVQVFGISGRNTVAASKKLSMGIRNILFACYIVRVDGCSGLG